MLPAFQLSEAIPGVAPERVYAHLSDPQALLGLQPLLVAVERVQRGRQGSALVDAAASQAAGEPPTGSSGVHGPEELSFEAVEAVPLLWGALRWRNRISVRLLLLGEGGHAPTPAAAAAAGAEGDPLRMRYAVVSPPAGLVRLEVVWSFHPLADTPLAQPGGSGEQRGDALPAPGAAVPAAGGGGGGGRGGTRVHLDVSIQAPWLLR